ncbi:MAG: hypothetical protein K2G44_00450 [Clostridia bacterium]|nr:hypothetical protein [Clostridia bacterium]
MRRKDDHVQSLDFDDEFMLESVEKRYQSGDYLGALTLLNKRNTMYAPSADASALAADIYEEMELYPLAADAWFRFLDTCNEADFSEGYEGLAVSFMNMGKDLQSAMYYQRFVGDGISLADLFEEKPAPKLRLVRSEDEEAPEVLAEGLSLLKAGDLEEARKVLSSISPLSPDYPTAAGICSMCSLMCGDEDAAENEALTLLKKYPDNVQALTTYCAVLGAKEKPEEAKKVARRLAAVPTDSTDDLYRIATALCETGLDKEAYEKLSILKQRLPYDDNVLYFHAVAGYRTGELEEAIDSLERLTTLYPRKAVAEYYLVRMREQLHGDGEPFSMTYYYRVPGEEYNAIAGFLLAADAAEDEKEIRHLGRLGQVNEFLRIAFDEMEGRDEKLQMIAAKVAVKIRADDFIREFLLDYEADDMVKLSIMHALTLRNEEESFGTVLCNIYKEFFTHTIEIGRRKRKEFMLAFADVYSKFAIVEEANEHKICVVAEELYQALEEAEAWDLMDDRAALAAAIYRESRFRKGERGIKKITDMFEADRLTTQKILNYLI